MSIKLRPFQFVFYKAVEWDKVEMIVKRVKIFFVVVVGHL